MLVLESRARRSDRHHSGAVTTGNLSRTLRPAGSRNEIRLARRMGTAKTVQRFVFRTSAVSVTCTSRGRTAGKLGKICKKLVAIPLQERIIHARNMHSFRQGLFRTIVALIFLPSGKRRPGLVDVFFMPAAPCRSRVRRPAARRRGEDHALHGRFARGGSLDRLAGLSITRSHPPCC